MSDDVTTEYWAEARAAEKTEQEVDRQPSRGRAQSEQRLLDKDSWMAAHRQLSLNAAQKDRTLRSKADADTALAEQQTFLLAQMILNKEEIMQ